MLTYAKCSTVKQQLIVFTTVVCLNMVSNIGPFACHLNALKIDTAETLGYLNRNQMRMGDFSDETSYIRLSCHNMC